MKICNGVKMWSTILGHKRQIEQLRKALETRRIPNAYLFSGLSGIGKNLVANTFTLALYCNKSPEVCESCASCVKIKNRSHPDVFFVEPKTEKILIDQVRTLQQQLQFHPLEGSQKVAIIDSADQMTEAAANSLLKILEEPPEKTHFILISAFPNRLLPTIRSRCQKITFSPLIEEDVVKYLVSQREFNDEEAKRLARISQGSIGSVAPLDFEFIEEVLGRLKNLLKGANSSDIIATAEIWSKEGERAPLVMDLIMSFYKDLIYANWAAGLERDFETVAKARDALSTSANKQLLFEQLLFTLTEKCRRVGA